MINNTYKHETQGLFGKIYTSLCNSTLIRKIRRHLFNLIPFVKLESDVESVVYLNWLVDTDKVTHLASNGVELLDLNGKTLLTILTYQHGNFRPSLFNFLKFLFPSPKQSNWRLYIKSVNDAEASGAVLFIKNIMDSLVFTLGTRLSSDVMLTHYTNHFQHRIADDRIETKIAPSAGSSPALFSDVSLAKDFNFPNELIAQFKSDEEVLKFICLQHSAYSEGADFDGLCKADIDLPIDIATVQPAKVNNLSMDWLNDIVEGNSPFTFVVPAVKFRVLNEELL